MLVTACGDGRRAVIAIEEGQVELENPRVKAGSVCTSFRKCEGEKKKKCKEAASFCPISEHAPITNNYSPMGR